MLLKRQVSPSATHRRRYLHRRQIQREVVRIPLVHHFHPQV
ncbi:hypothetical protein ACVW0B_002083, partial [Thermostichus sp. MS-CIW-23]